MSVVLVLMVALTFPNDRPVEYRPVQYWDAVGSTLATYTKVCKERVNELYQQGTKARCELMTKDRMLMEARK